MICKCVTVLRQNVSLRQRYLSNRYSELQNAYSCVIGMCIRHDYQFTMHKGNTNPLMTLIGSQSIENDVIVLL